MTSRIFHSVSCKARGGVIAHGKPRWMPVAASKEFNLRPVDHAPQSEVEQMNRLQYKYEQHFSAVTQYLYNDYLKYSDTGEAAVIEAKKEQEELAKNIADNDAENAQVADRRRRRLEAEMAERKVQIDAEVKEKAELEAERLKQVEQVVKAETEALSKRIRREDLERAIEEAIANPVDHEYAIDLEGNIYRGRFTRPSPETAEKIAVPEAPSESESHLLERERQ